MVTGIVEVHVIVFGLENAAGEAPVSDRREVVYLPHMRDIRLLVGVYSNPSVGSVGESADMTLKAGVGEV